MVSLRYKFGKLNYKRIEMLKRSSEHLYLYFFYLWVHRKIFSVFGLNKWERVSMELNNLQNFQVSLTSYIEGDVSYDLKESVSIEIRPQNKSELISLPGSWDLLFFLNCAALRKSKHDSCSF